MNLKILKSNTSALHLLNKQTQQGIQELYLSYQEVNNSRVLLYLCSKTIETLEIEVDDVLNVEVLKVIRNLSREVKITIDYKPTKKTLDLLIALCPDKAGILRKTFMLNKDLMEVL